ncbi:hypothetical protein HRbin03_00303 [archaeon HR03]|nr:hypothetical protein HRbin03_00303 [archaeon HR03]
MRASVVLLLIGLLFLLVAGVEGLSPPRLVELGFSGTALRVDTDGDSVVALAFRDRDVLGLYYMDIGSYLEVKVGAPVVMTVFSKNFAAALLQGGGRIALVDLDSKKVDTVELEASASSLAGDDTGVYVVYPRLGRVEKLDPVSRQVAASWNVRVSESIKAVSAADGVFYGLSESLDELITLGDGVSRVRLDGLGSLVKASGRAVWVVRGDDTVLRIVGSAVTSKTPLPSATFVTDAVALDDKLVYVSVSRRVVGVVDQQGFRESRLAEQVPVSVAASRPYSIWFLDGQSNKLYLLFDSLPPVISEKRLETSADRSTTVRVRVGDPDNDLDKVMVQLYEYQGTFPLDPRAIPMDEVGGFWVTVYRPGEGVTKTEFFVNATDKAGNSVLEKIGEADYRSSPTGVQVTVVETTAPQNPATFPILFSEMLLLVPLILVATLFVFARRGRRKKSKKR